jgi:L-asparaginase / beta-aspartyl-peptidase
MTYGLVVHGGAGTILKEKMSPELEKEYREALAEALCAGEKILKNGGSSLDAIVAVNLVFEDSPLFNAGKGACYTNDETHELDASIMDGSNLEAGAVTGVKHIKNPILLARLIMEKSNHVMLSGEGAENFAAMHDIETVDQEYFHTERRMQQLLRSKANEESSQNLSEDVIDEKAQIVDVDDKKFGTVGAVALDQAGNLAAGTTTGGMTNKRFGRIGDSPIIGAGNYANNQTCAVSCSGHGELFIRAVAAYEVSALMEHKGMNLQQAADTVVHEKLMSIGGRGGLIAIDHKGNMTMSFNSPGMYRGMVGMDGEQVIKIFKEEDL